MILWFYSRLEKRAAGCLILSLIASYLYLVYMLAGGAAEQAWLDLSMLLAFNVVALRTRLSHESVAAALHLRKETLRKLARMDESTSLYDRGLICELGRKEFDRVRRGGGFLSVLLIHLDGLQEINGDRDRDGGDRALAGLTATITGTLRSQDLAGRYGTSEFLVVLRDADLSGATNAAERLRQAFASRAVRGGDQPAPPSVSVGIAAHSRPSKSFQELVDRAGFALCEARSRGRGRIHSWPAPGGSRSGSNGIHTASA